MELKDLEEIIERNGLELKQQVGLALSEQEAKDIIEAAVSEVFSLHVVSKSFCNNCKSGLIDYPEINRRTCRCGALGYNVC